MGYGDLFVAAVLGALLAAAMGRRWQLRGALLTALFALGFDLLFFVLDELPATVPPALTLLVLIARRRGLTQNRTAARARTRPAHGAGARPVAPPGAAPAGRPAKRAPAAR